MGGQTSPGLSATLPYEGRDQVNGAATGERAVAIHRPLPLTPSPEAGRGKPEPEAGTPSCPSHASGMLSGSPPF